MSKAELHPEDKKLENSSTRALAAFQPGFLFDRQFEIISIIGEGASGVIYKALDKMLQREIALKVIHAHLLKSADSVDKFKKEAVLELNHPNICKIYKQGKDESGNLYLAMEFLEGETLAELIAKNGKLDFDLFFELLPQIIAALAFAHKNGIIHLDIKPANVIVTVEQNKSRAVLIDFGIARWLSKELEKKTETEKQAAAAGTGAYMSPEQCSGSELDARSDIYSLGCLMLECLAGRTPFEGETNLELMYKHMHESISKLGFLCELPEALAKLIRKCLEKDPASRYQSMEALSSDFKLCQDMQDTLKRRYLSSSEKNKKRGSMLLPVLLALSLIAASLLSLKHYFSESQKSQNYNKFNSIKKDAPASRRNLYISCRDVDRIVKEYKSKNDSESVKVVYDRWTRELFAKSSPENRVEVFARAVADFAELKMPEKALEYAELAFKSPQRQLRAGKVTGAIASMYESLGKPQKGIDYYNNVLKRFPELEGSDEFLNNAPGRLAFCYIALGDYETAKAILRALFNKFDSIYSRAQYEHNYWRLFLIKCLLHDRREENRKEIEKLAKQNLTSANRASELKSDRNFLLTAYCELIAEFKAAKDYRESNKYLEELIKELSRLGKQRNVLEKQAEIAENYELLGDLAKSEKILQGLILQLEKPEQIALLMRLSNLQSEMKNKSQALNYAEKAYELSLYELEHSKSDLSSESDLQIVRALEFYMVRLVQSEGNSKTTKEKIEQLIDRTLKTARTKSDRSLLLAVLYKTKTAFHIVNSEPAAALASAREATQIYADRDFQKRLAANKVKSEKYEADLAILILQLETEGSQLDKAAKTAAEYLRLETASGASRQVIFSATAQLAFSQLVAGQKEESAKTAQTAETLLKELLAPDFDISAASGMRILAAVKRSNQEYEKAEKLLSDCIKLTKKLKRWTGETPLVLLCQKADIEQAKGEIPDSKELEEEIKKPGARTQLGWYKKALNTLADICITKHDYKKAEHYLKEYLKEANSEELPAAREKIANLKAKK